MKLVSATLSRTSDSADAFAGGGGSTDPLSLGTEVPGDAPANGTPTTGVRLFSALRANRRQPAWISPTGRSERVQSFLGSNDLKILEASGTGTTNALGYTTSGTSVQNDVGTTFASPTMATTNFLTMQTRKTIATAATANSLQEVKPNHFWCSRRSVGGGFHFTMRFGLETAFQATGRLFAGLHSATTAIANADPRGALANAIGIAKNSADTTLGLMLSTATATSFQNITLTNTGAVGWNTLGTMFQLEIFCAAGDAGFGWRVVRWNPTTAAIVTDQGYVNTGNMPAIDTLFCPHLWGSNVAAAVQTLAFVSMYCETD